MLSYTGVPVAILSVPGSSDQSPSASLETAIPDEWKHVATLQEICENGKWECGDLKNDGVGSDVRNVPSPRVVIDENNPEFQEIAVLTMGFRARKGA